MTASITNQMFYSNPKCPILQCSKYKQLINILRYWLHTNFVIAAAVSNATTHYNRLAVITVSCIILVQFSVLTFLLTSVLIVELEVVQGAI